MGKMVTDQADGLRKLMASTPGRRVAVIDGEPVGVANVAANLAAAWVQRGKDVLLLDEHIGPSLAPERRAGQLVLINAVQDGDGALSPAAVQADHIVVVLQANAASITACYSRIKMLARTHALQRLRVLVNRVEDTGGAQRILANLAETGSRYLSLTLEPAGWVRADPLMVQAQRLNLTVVEAFESSPAARDFCQIASGLLQWPVPRYGAPTDRRQQAEVR